MERIAQDAMLETEMEEGKLSVVVCAGWNTLSQTTIRTIHQWPAT